jgi:hypothetical protein
VAESPASLLAAWHEFFTLIGTAAATLIGAMFVVVSIGVGILTRGRIGAIRTFLTATVIHLSTVLFGCALTMVPAVDPHWLAAIAGIAGLAGIAYSGRLVWGFGQHSGTDRSDWFWYAIFPLIAYAVLVASAAIGLSDTALGLDLFAAVLAFLLIAGIRNAWDMLVFFVTASRDPTT